MACAWSQRRKTPKALMCTEVGSKSLPASNYRINECAQNNSRQPLFKHTYDNMIQHMHEEDSNGLLWDSANMETIKKYPK